MRDYKLSKIKAICESQPQKHACVGCPISFFCTYEFNNAPREWEIDKGFFNKQKITNRTIAVDFDGVLCEEKYPQIGRERKSIITLIKKLKIDGNTLILNTCRVGERLKEAVEWCRQKGIEFDYVNENPPEKIALYGSDCRKISADIYIDDKAVRL